jgi:hypothetical protein
MSYQVRQNPASKQNYDDSRAKVDMVVIHHAASTSFDSIGAVFANPGRGASAHYGVGRNNNVDQYVPENKTAWHCGNYPVNQRSIGIENVNSSGAPNWEVAPETKNTLVELVTDICRRNPGIGKLEVGRNLFGHKQVASPSKPTACPVTLIDFLPELAQRVNAALDGNTGGGGTPAPAPGKKSNQEIANEVLAGNWGNNPQRREKLIAAGYDYNAIQAIVNGQVGNPVAAPKASNEVIADQVIAGAWGNNPERQNKLAAAGYDYGAIQAIVNRKVGGGGAPAQPARLSNEQVADQVLAGAWGNGDDRRNRLVGAGYDFNAVQSIVNARLGQNTPARASNDTVANQVINGDWGNGDVRRQKLAAAGYDYGTIQALVNRKLGL